MDARAMHVVCTAGHVDHGKSTLVRTLTGIEPDRFAEERRRGLTIDIGYAWTTVGDHTLAFVDLPGHERFVANMLAGAGAARLALFVVAADEGWMPQSAEHLAILDLLGVAGGVVALTRADLVDDETAELSALLVREELAGSVLADAPMVTVSAATGVGMDALRAALGALLDAHPVDVRGARPRLWVDRVFTIAGAGTVVTGTLAGGTLEVGAEVTLTPGGATARVRGLQQLHGQVEVATPGRVAINLAGVPKEAARRGSAVTRGAWTSATTVDVHARAVGDRPLRRRGAWHLHVGSSERLVRVEPWEGDVGRSGGMLRLRFDPPLALEVGDRMVLREAGARETVGGGVVLDPDPPPRPRGRRARQERVAALEARHAALTAGDVTGLIRGAVDERGAMDRHALVATLGAPDVDARAAEAGLLRIGGAWVAPEALARWTAAVHDALTDFHKAAPLAPGAPRDEVLRALDEAGCPPSGTSRDFAVEVVSHLERAADVVADGPTYRLPEHAVKLDAEQEAAREALLALLDATPFRPPDLADAAARAGASDALVRALEAAGDLVRLDARVAYTGTALQAAVQRLRVAFGDKGPLTAAEAREALGTTRKFVVPLLEELDRRGITRRVGDRREVR